MSFDFWREVPRPGTTRWRGWHVAVLLFVAVSVVSYFTPRNNPAGLSYLGPWLPAVGLIVLLLAIVVPLAWLQITAKAREYLGVAAARGFTPVPASALWRTGVGDLSVLARRGSYASFSQPVRRRIDGVDVWIFIFNDGQPDSFSIHSVAAFDFGSAGALPRFSMRPRGLAAFGLRGAFRDRYRLTSTDEAGLREVLRPAVVAFFDAEPVAWWVESDGRWLALRRPGMIGIAGFDAFVDDAARVVTALTNR